jgi:hypothetical protein
MSEAGRTLTDRAARRKAGADPVARIEQARSEGGRPGGWQLDEGLGEEAEDG